MPRAARAPPPRYSDEDVGSDGGMSPGGDGGEQVLMVRNLNTGKMVPLELLAEQRVGPRAKPAPARLSTTQEQLLLPANMVPQIRKLAFVGAPLVGSQIRVEPVFSALCTHTTRWRRLRARDGLFDGHSTGGAPAPRPYYDAPPLEHDDGVVGTSDTYTLSADDMGSVLVAEVTPVGTTGVPGMTGTATTLVVTLSPALQYNLVAAVERGSAYFDMLLVEALPPSLQGAPANSPRASLGSPATAEKALAAHRGPTTLPPRPVRLLLGPDGAQLRTLSRIPGPGREARRHATLFHVGYSSELRARTSTTDSRRLGITLAAGLLPFKLLAVSAAEAVVAVITLRAFACLGDRRTALGVVLWPNPELGLVESVEREAEGGYRVATPAVGGHVSFSGQPLVGSTLYVHLPIAPGSAPVLKERDYAREHLREHATALRLHARTLNVAWRRSRVGSGRATICRGSYLIDGAGSISYTLSADDVGCFVYAEVSPVGADGVAGLRAVCVTAQCVGLPEALNAQLAAAAALGEARFSVIDVAALAAAHTHPESSPKALAALAASNESARGGKLQLGGKFHGFQASLVSKLAASRIGMLSENNNINLK